MTIKKYTGYGFDRSVERVLKVEGGYGNHPNDPGGETNMGITKATANMCKDLWGNWNGNMRTLPVSVAKAIYKRNFWDKIKGDALHELHPLLADHLFDFAVNAGPGRAVEHLQKALNALNNRQTIYKDTAADGKMGPGTLTSLRAYAAKRGEKGLESLVLMLVSRQITFYQGIVENKETSETFMYGWLERGVNKLKSYVLAMNQ